MNEIRIFNYQSNQQVRTVVNEQTGELWFVAKDVTDILEIDSTQARRLDDDEKGLYSIQTPGGSQEMTVINEAGLYSLVLGSRKPEAKEFKRWITHQVIPAIRKHGGYLTPAMVDKVLSDPDTIIRLATELKHEREQRKLLEAENAQKQAKIEEDKPKVEFFDDFIGQRELYSLTEAGKILGITGFSTWLRKNKYMNMYDRVYAQYKKYLTMVPNPYHKYDTMVTPVGLAYFAKKNTKTKTKYS